MGGVCGQCGDAEVVVPIYEETCSPRAVKVLGKEEPEAPVVWGPLRFTIVSATNLRNADWSLPFMHNVSDPFCICEIKGKPLSRTVTDVVDNKLDPYWGHEVHFGDFEDGDTLIFTIWDKDVNFKSNDFLGQATLADTDFHPNGFDDDILLVDAGKNRKAYLRVKVEPAVQEKPKSTVRASTASSLSAPGMVKTTSMASVYSRTTPSSNKNTTADYNWLEDCLCTLSANKAETLSCSCVATKTSLTPVLFVIGGCPNALCGMQAVMFAVDSSSALDFWWVKPSKTDPTKLEKDTLNRNDSGKNKNDPGRSKPFYQPLADLFQQGSRVKNWSFGLKKFDHASGQVMRAFIKNESNPDEVLYMLYLWQEDWTTNPFARSKYIKGKLVYQRSLDSTDYFFKQYEIHDGVAFISDGEDGPGSNILALDDIKVLYEIGAGR